MACASKSILWGLLALTLTLSGLAQAQTAQKPSFYRARQQSQEAAANAHQRPADAAPFLPALRDRAEFDRLARVHDAGSVFEVPHLLFVIDRADHDRVHYVNTRRYALHEQFVLAQHLTGQVSRSALASNYRSPDRRFLFGTLAWQIRPGRWTYEFWEGDQLTPPLLTLARARLQATFFAPLAFKTNSTQHLSVAQAAGLDVVTQAQILQEQTFMPLNTGRAQGRLRLIESVDAAQDLAPDDIVVLREVPLSLPPVAGVITIQASTVLSHVNLLAKGWGIPNAYLRDAFEALASQDGQWVELRVTRSGYSVKPSTRPASAPLVAGKPALVSAPTLTRLALTPLSELRAKDRVHCGAKAGNLGEIASAWSARHSSGVAPVPEGYCIPFAQYAEFIRSAPAARRIAQAEQTPGFDEDAATRRQALQALRHDLAELPFETAHAAAWKAQWVKQWREQLGQGGVFVRSSSNSEDLPRFSGAGLYATVPNVRDEAALVRAVQTVWASVFNAEAYEARRQARIPHDRVVMGVLVQRAVDAQAAGVMVTRDPFDATHRDTTLITAKHGLGIQVVEGRQVAEQVLYNRRDKAVQVLTRSADDTALQLDEHGGVKSVPVDRARQVLSDDMVRRLAQVGERCKRLLGGRDQDIEWAIDRQGDIVVLQSRPFIDRAD
ncbi:MAG: pyruvate, phosphate dikinase [Rubrivivax sp.]|nr:MAG: pyruvate, phosphate dikinase [Rubrivivax sp.]